MSADPFQDAYLLHQARKKEQLLHYKEDAFHFLATSRHSDRIFKPDPISPELLRKLNALMPLAPSSCNRHAMTVSEIKGDHIPPLASLLVGGKNWLDYAPLVFLIFAHPEAYKAPGELSFMPYLDGGFLAMHILYSAHSLNLASCFCNPNIRPEDLPIFNPSYNSNALIFTGAIAIGYPFP